MTYWLCILTLGGNMTARMRSPEPTSRSLLENRVRQLEGVQSPASSRSECLSDEVRDSVRNRTWLKGQDFGVGSQETRVPPGSQIRRLPNPYIVIAIR